MFIIYICRDIVYLCVCFVSILRYVFIISYLNKNIYSTNIYVWVRSRRVTG